MAGPTSLGRRAELVKNSTRLHALCVALAWPLAIACTYFESPTAAPPPRGADASEPRPSSGGAGASTAAVRVATPATPKYAAPIEADGGEIPVGGVWGSVGGACTREEPCAIADFVADPGPQRALVLLDGVYRGKRSMLRLPMGFGGSADRPLYIGAENDGRVLIDAGQTGPALQVLGSWTLIEGIDVRSQTTVANVTTHRSTDERTHHVTLRRVVAYKDPIPCRSDPCRLERDRPTYEAATPENMHVLSTSRTDHVLFEDVAAFGRGRKAIEVYRATNATLRRVWARQEGNWPYVNSSNLKSITCMYRSLDTLCENVLATVGGSPDTRIQPADYRDRPQIASTDAQPKVDKHTGRIVDPFVPEGRDPHAVGLRILGSIFYSLPGSKLVASHGLRIGAGGGYPGKGMKGVVIDDVAVWLPRESSGSRLALMACDEGRLPGQMDGCEWSHGESRASAPLVFDDVTLRGGAKDRIHADWVRGRNVNARPAAERGVDIYTPGGPGASICFRTVDGVVTDEPLWPWPMQDRIERATRRSLWETADIEADLATIFAPVPDRCRHP